jgi:glutathione S-transferase
VYLLHRWKCPWCAAARQGIENVGAPVELVEVPYPREERDALMAVSGQRRVPVLVDGDEVIIGSRQVVRHVYSRYGGEAFERSVLELDQDIAAEGDVTSDVCELPEASGSASSGARLPHGRSGKMPTHPSLKGL